MGTFNFNKLEDFTTAVYQAEEIYSKEDFINLTCEDEQDCSDESFYAWLNEQESYAYSDYKEVLKEFNKNLNFYYLSLESGYYGGFQVNVSNFWGDDGQRIPELDNYDTMSQYGLYLSHFKRKEKAEFNRIEKFLKTFLPQIMISGGWCPAYSKIGEVK